MKIYHLLKPEQINEVAKGINKVENVGEMIQWLPFVSKETADKIAEKALEYDDIILEDLLPFISKGVADSIAEKALSNGVYNLIDLLPFVSEKYSDIIMRRRYGL